MQCMLFQRCNNPNGTPTEKPSESGIKNQRRASSGACSRFGQEITGKSTWHIRDHHRSDIRAEEAINVIDSDDRREGGGLHGGGGSSDEMEGSRSK